MEITLTDAVAVVLGELEEAAADGLFELGEIKLDFAVELREEHGPGTRLRPFVALPPEPVTPLGASTAAQRVAIRLTPQAGAGRGEQLLPGDRARPEGPGDVSGHIGRG